MKTITHYITLLFMSLIISTITAQETQLDSIKKDYKATKIEALINSKKTVEEKEKEYLKQDIEAINKQLDNGEITAQQAEQLKQEAANKRALNIQNRLAIIDNQIALWERSDKFYEVETDKNGSVSVSIGSKGIDIDLGPQSGGNKVKYDIRTSNELLFAIGFNNTLMNGSSLEDSPYKLGGSGFVELGWLWETRLLKESNFLRLNYGFSFQWNKLNPKDDQYFVQNGDVTTLETFPVNLKKSEFRVTNLVFPVHLEFGPSRRWEKSDRIRFNTDDKFTLGIGGYGGFRLGTQQKLKFEDDGDNVKQKTKRNFNTSNFVYGLSGYIGVGDIALYVKYDLNPLFKNQDTEQNNVSLGLRFNID